MAAPATNTCLFKDKECTQALTLDELQEAFGKRQIIIRNEYETDGGNIGIDCPLLLYFSKAWNESVTPNIAYGEASDIEGHKYYTKEKFDTTS